MLDIIRLGYLRRDQFPGEIFISSKLEPICSLRQSEAAEGREAEAIK